jgi:hypothetical protein
MKFPKSYQWILPVVCLAALTTKGGGDPAPQSQVDFKRGAQGTFNADWDGVAGRTYFTEFSLDLINWHYAPFIDFGEGGQHRGIESNTDKFFLRLHYGEFPGINSLDDAMNADLDGDGLSNIFEVTHGYDPFDINSTIDGADNLLDPDGDGLGNSVEQSHGTNPMTKDNPLLQLEVTVD